jgi:hypothetical protein
VGKNASVCAILCLIGERRQTRISTTVNADNDDTLQRLALSILEYGLEQTMTKDMTRQEMLFKPWLGDKSGNIQLSTLLYQLLTVSFTFLFFLAIQWALYNDCFIFLNGVQVQDGIKVNNNNHKMKV